LKTPFYQEGAIEADPYQGKPSPMTLIFLLQEQLPYLPLTIWKPQGPDLQGTYDPTGTATVKSQATTTTALVIPTMITSTMGTTQEIYIMIATATIMIAQARICKAADTFDLETYHMIIMTIFYLLIMMIPTITTTGRAMMQTLPTKVPATTTIIMRRQMSH